MFRRNKKTGGQEAVPYSRLASIYDYVMRHVDYIHWASYVESIFARHDLSPRRILDLACGTGSLAVELSQRGYVVSGADGCAEMLRVAEEKARRNGFQISYCERNLLDLSDLPVHECVLCLYDSMNYMMNLEDMARALSQVNQVVEPGGVFVFDVCTESNSMRHFRDMTDRDQGDGFTYRRHSSYRDGTQYNVFEIHFEETDEIVEETHRQRIYPLSEVKDVLDDSPFEVESVYGGFGFEEPTELSDRVHFVLRGM